MTQPIVTERRVKPAHELVAGDVIADDLYDEPTPVLGVHEFEECGHAAILAVVRDAQSCAFAREFDYDAPVPVLAVEPNGYEKAVAELRRIAGILEALPPAPLAEPNLQVSLILADDQAPAVDVIAKAAIDGSGRMQSDNIYYATSWADKCSFTVQCRVNNAREAELERLRARVAELEAANAKLDEQATGDPFGYSREEDPTPVSPARGGPVHTGGVVDGGQLADETPAIPVTVHFTFGVGHFDGSTDLFGKYVTVIGPSWQRCRQAMVNRYGGAWCDQYDQTSQTFREVRHRLTEHERIVVFEDATVRLVLDDVHAEALAENAEAR